MNTVNIILAGVGGQGLVLTTQIICEAALRAGKDVKSNDVVGLSQRGGKVWGSVRIGDVIHSPNIPPKSGDILIAMEPLEGLRWSGMLKDGGLVIMNTLEIPPVPVMAEKAEYPKTIQADLEKSYKAIAVDAFEESRRIGSVKIANTLLIGAMAKRLDIPVEIWHEVLRENVPPKFIEMNIEAFDFGWNL